MANGQEDYPLFTRFPGLRDRIPRICLGEYPTPVHRLEGFKGADLWIKRDDRISPLYGGNKVRKLEPVLGEVLRRKKDLIVTMGGLGTHHGLATAIFAKTLGLGCELLLFDQPVTDHVLENLLLLHRYGARLVYCGTTLKMAWQFSLTRCLRHPGAYFLYAGGSTPRGTLGFVNAALELRQQIERGLLPEPDIIVCPLGSNGTMAGLEVGLRLAGLHSGLVGVRVTEAHLGPVPLATPGTVRSLATRTLRLLRSCGVNSDLTITKNPPVIDTYFGDGYGYSTAPGEQAAREMASRTGIVLDQTYTAKTCAYILDVIKNPSPQVRKILYWHTLNSVDLRAQAGEVRSRDLPLEFQRFFPR